MTELTTDMELWAGDAPSTAWIGFDYGDVREPVTITYGTPGLRSIEFSADPSDGTISIASENLLADDETPTFTVEEFGLIAALLLNALGE